MKNITIVFVLSTVIVFSQSMLGCSYNGAISNTSTSSIGSTSSSTKTQSSLSVCKKGNMKVSYPSSWESDYGIDMTTIIPSYDGRMVVYAEKLSDDNKRKSKESVVDSMVEELMSLDIEFPTGEHREIETYPMYISRHTIAAKTNDGKETNKGNVQIAVDDEYLYYVAIFVPQNDYESKENEIDSILDSMEIERPIDSANTNNSGSEPSNSSISSQTNTIQETQKQKTFEFGEGVWDSNSSYKRFIGTIKNTSDTTHYFIQIRGSFLDENDNTIDTDWTYACGDEGLRPGESTKFTLSVMQDSRIKRIEYNVYDYD